MKRILLTQGQFTIVDDEDFDVLSKYCWHAHYDPSMKSFYAERNTSGANRTTIKMHREILGLKHGDGIHTDHINHDTLDNRRCNLRVVTHRENQQNRKNPGTSRFPGVCWDRAYSKWKVQVKINKKDIHLGCYHDELEAAQAYREACQSLGKA